jgi:putative transposase
VALGEVIADVREGLLAMAVGTGLQMMDADVAAVCGPKGVHDPDRAAVRHGTGPGSVTLGGRRVPVTRPRVRAADGSGELPVPSYAVFTGTELLGRLALQKMLAGISTRGWSAGLEPVGERTEQVATSTSKSAVSRKFVAATEAALAELLARPLGDLDLVALMIDGVHFGDHLCVVALGISTDGVKHPLALVDGDTENTTVVTDLLVGLRDRGLDTTRPVLVVIDGAKALHSAVTRVFDHPVIARCQLHKLGINRPSGVGQVGCSGCCLPPNRSRCCSRLVWTRAWRAASSFQPRVLASARSARTSSSCALIVAIAVGSGTKKSHCSQMLA